MSQPLDDLLPLFLAEVRERLERLAVLASEVEGDEETARRARRELHALKGASNMMRLKDLAAVFHDAEGLLGPVVPGASQRLLETIDRVHSRVDALGAGDSQPAPGGPGETPGEAAAEPPFARDGGGEPSAVEVRVPAATVSELADRSLRLRLLAVGLGTTVERVFQLARLAERGLADRDPRQVLASISTSLRQLAFDWESGQRNLHQLADAQLEALLRLQVQPLRPYLLGLGRHARDLARSLDKEVEVEVLAGSSQLDRRIVEALREVFLHLVRNAVDHGVESPEARESRGKRRAGRLRLEATTEGGRVRVSVSDDGSGIDPAAVASAASGRGLMPADEATRLAPADALQLLFLPGFSTRGRAGEVSGRGIGLDAVAEAVRGLGGDLAIRSAVGEGTTVTLDLPVARSADRVLVCTVGQAQVALPAAVVHGFERADGRTLVHQGGRSLLEARGGLVPVQAVGRLLGAEIPAEAVLVACEVGGTRLDVLVDDVVGEEEVLLRPLAPFAGLPPCFDSVALLSTGRPVAVLAPHLLRVTEEPQTEVSEPSRRRGPLRLLLVDDSQVTLEMLKQLLEAAGFVVTAVGSAGDALALLGAQEFDCLLTDVEMPGMDGLELTRTLRDTPEHANLPVVVVSTRDRPQDHVAGLEAGADAYVAKQHLDARELVTLIRRVGGRP